MVVYDSEKVEERDQVYGQARCEGEVDQELEHAQTSPTVDNETTVAMNALTPSVTGANIGKVKEVEAVNQDPTVGPRIKDPSDLNIQHFLLPIRSCYATYWNIWENWQSLRRYGKSLFIYYLLNLAPKNEHMQAWLPE